VTSIGPTQHLLSAIRAQALAHRRRSQRTGGAPEAESAPAEASGGRSDWLVEVARGVLAIAEDDPQRNRKAFRIYLQAVLARECAIEHAEDPQFQALVDQVQGAMDLDPRLAEAMAIAGAELLKGTR
jgi:hypothetical protein